MRLLLLILPAIGFGILAGSPAAAQSCGPPCKKCAAELGVPLDAQGLPIRGASGRAWDDSGSGAWLLLWVAPEACPSRVNGFS